MAGGDCNAVADSVGNSGRTTIFSTQLSPAGAAYPSKPGRTFDHPRLDAGLADMFWKQAVAPWDAAAGALLTREAGGEISLWMDYCGAT